MAPVAQLDNQTIIRAQSPHAVDPAFMQMMEENGLSGRQSWHDETGKTASSSQPSTAIPRSNLSEPTRPGMSPVRQTSGETLQSLNEEILGKKNRPDFAPKLIEEKRLEVNGHSPDEVLVDVLIEGNATIPVSSVARYIKTRPGRPATVDQIRDDIRSLYSTKWFFTIEPVYRRTEKGLVLIFKVTELPILRSVQYAGNDKVKDNVLAGITGLKPLHAFSVATNRESVRRIQDYYKQQGYLYAEVSLDKGNSPEDREVIFRINEGPKVRVSAIRFRGNKDISSSVLKLRLTTKKRILWRFGGQYDPATVPSDIATIKQYYHNIGYFDVQVKENLEFTADRSTVQVIFNIDEGPRYKIRNIVFKGNEIYSQEQLLAKTELKEGQFFNARDLSKDVDSMQSKYGELGRLFAKVKPGTRFTKQAGVLDLVYNIDEDRVYRIGMINVNIRGQHTHTKETVALNRMHVSPGDLADPEGIRKSRAALGGDPSFERGGPDGVQINLTPVTNPTYLSQAVDPNPSVIRGASNHFGSSSLHRPYSSEARTTNRTRKTHNEFVLTNWKTDRKAEQTRQSGSVQQIPGAGHTFSPTKIPTSARHTKVPREERYYREYRKERSELNQLMLYQPIDIERSPVFFENSKPFVQTMASAPPKKEQAPVIRGQNRDPFAEPPGGGFTNPPAGPPILSPQLPPGYVDLDVNLTEARTGRFMVGASVNSDSGVFGNIVLEEQNFDIMRFPTSWRDVVDGYAFRGGGQQFRLEATPGNEVSRYLASWTNPHFLDTDYSLGLSGFYYQRFFRDWSETRTGGRISVGKLLTRELSINNAIRLEKVHISNLRLNAPSLLPTLGDTFLGTFKSTLNYDTRDSTMMATEGYNLQGSVEQGFGDQKFTKLEAQGSQYYTVYQRPDGAGKHVLSFRGNLGWTTDDTPAFERFYAGGFQTFRGLKFRSVSPLEPPNLGTNGAQVGGNFQMLGTAEYMLPIMASETVRMVAFTDFGSVEKNVSLNNFRVSVGGGLRITVPQMGPVPIALDWAVPVVKQDTDVRQLFSFYIGLTR